MNIVKISIGVQIALVVLAVILLCAIYLINKLQVKVGKVYNLLTCIPAIILVFALFRFLCWEGEGYYYVYEFKEEFNDSKSFILDNTFLNKVGISDEDLNSALPLDRVEVHFKEDTSGVTLLDILFCNGTKWLEGEVVSTTEYTMLDGKDIELITDYNVYSSTVNELTPSHDKRVVKSMYIELGGALYAVNLETFIDNNKRYVLMWDKLDKIDKVVSGKVRDVYQTCVVSEYIE